MGSSAGSCQRTAATLLIMHSFQFQFNSCVRWRRPRDHELTFVVSPCIRTAATCDNVRQRILSLPRRSRAALIAKVLDLNPSPNLFGFSTSVDGGAC